MPSADIVFLLPGFLGFERAGNFRNFADRVASALRTRLEARLEREVPVVPMSSLETTTFAARQGQLLQNLSRHLLAHPEIERIHLVGHSVGGVDAYLLTCRDALERGVWSELDPHGLRAKIRSVTSIAAPHGGTCFTEAPRASSVSLRALVDDPRGALASITLINKLFASALHDVGRPSAGSLLREGRKVQHFLEETVRWHDFLPQLAPDAMESLYATVTPIADVQRKSFVTMAGRPKDAGRPGDAFFVELARRTGGNSNGFTRHPSRLRDAIGTLRVALEDPARLIVSAASLPPAHVDAQTNDGLVNSARQLIQPSDSEELAGIVVADHFDVLGYYDRELSLADQPQSGAETQVSGLLHSGSFFRDTEFFALYRRVADVIAEVGREEPVAVSPEPAPEKTKRTRAGSRTPSRRPTA